MRPHARHRHVIARGPGDALRRARRPRFATVRSAERHHRRRAVHELHAPLAQAGQLDSARAVVDRLLDEESGNVADLEELIGKTIRFQVETMYTQEQYDVILV